jgi:MFS family permease
MDPADEFRTSRYVGVGCLTAVAGMFSGGMIGVFVAKVVGSATSCKPEPDLPACNWHVYAGIGMLIGVISLPILAISRLRRGERTEAQK